MSVATANDATQPGEDQQRNTGIGQEYRLNSDSTSGSKTESEGFWGAIQFANPEEPGDFGDDFKCGIGGVAGFDHRLRSSLWFLIGLSYARFTNQDHFIGTDRIGLFAVSMDLKWTPIGSKQTLRPYLVAGVGMALLWRRGDDIVEHTDEEGFPDRWRLRGRESWCYNYGVGLEKRLTDKISIFAQYGSVIIPNITDNSNANHRMRLTNFLLGFQIATKQRRESRARSGRDQRGGDNRPADTNWDSARSGGMASAFNVYGGVGASATNEGSTRTRKHGVGFSVGLGRDLSHWSEVVLKGTFISFGRGPKIPALGLYTKVNLLKRHHKSWVYLLAGGGGLAVRKYNATTTFYLGTGLGYIVKTSDTRNLNLELRWLVPTRGGSRTSNLVLATIGVAI